MALTYNLFKTHVEKWTAILYDVFYSLTCLFYNECVLCLPNGTFEIKIKPQYKMFIIILDNYDKESRLCSPPELS